MKSSENRILVTGGTSGIGREVLRKYDTPENEIYLITRKSSEEINSKLTTRAKLTVIQQDLQLPFSEEIINKLDQKFNLFIHCAGMEYIKPLKYLTTSDVNSLMHLHVYSFLELLKCIEKSKKKIDNYWTSVVSISSIASESGGIGQTAYSLSKAALEAATITLNKELSAKKIRLNVIKPGLVKTEMTLRWMDKIGLDEIQLNEIQLNGIPKPEDIVNLIDFLLSEESFFISGKIIPIDGGGIKNKLF